MSTGRRSNQPVEQLLNQFGLTADPASIQACGQGIIFRFREPENAAHVLSNGVVFARGRLGFLHGGQIGGVSTEYRSYTDGIGCSLHVVLGKKGPPLRISTVSIHTKDLGSCCFMEFWNWVHMSSGVRIDARWPVQPLFGTAGAEKPRASAPNRRCVRLLHCP